eukprot:XP_012814109.1 PREDICTED: eukaryotic translation initiation factor 2D isoform X3 [Xenopus tropicalis]
MFAKNFRVKSNTAIKGSDRRKLRADISSAFPFLTTENLSELMPSKEELSIVKVFAHKGDAVTLYVHNRNPVMFELEKNLYPTVYALWKYPDLLPAFTTWPPVLEKMAGGADLMLPGVVVPSFGLPEIQQGSLCAITLVGNRAPVAVGVATMSSKEMLASGMKGKGFNILHTFGDQLWAYGDKSCLPNIPIPEVSLTVVEEGDGQAVSQEVSSEAQDPQAQLENLNLMEEETTHKEEDSEKHCEGVDEQIKETENLVPLQKSSQEAMDSLLHQCFFHALKHKVKKSDLPLLTSTFLRNYLFACCPEGQQVDIKKSSYKKLTKFLQTMQQRKVLQVKELNKGVESIVEIDWKHPEKGDLLTHSDVRSIIITYVKNNELVDSNNKNFVNINPVLCDCLLEKSEQNDFFSLKWDDLLLRCLEKMQHSHQVTFPGRPPIIRKGNIDPIDISVVQRASNKKVTMIKNLELYGLDPSSVGSMLQQRVQASSTCTAIPGSKDRVQVQIQGNQVSQVGKLLLEEFKIPRKYISGLDLAKSGKKK